jgi:predicted phosphodiesterase
MKIAVISDIHSNLEALTKVLECIDEHNIDEIVCVGDIVGYGANPNECLDLVQKRCAHVVLGNHDAAVFNPRVTRTFTVGAFVSAQWTRTVIEEKYVNYLRALPISLNYQNAFFTHGSPLFPEEWNYITSDYEAKIAFKKFSQHVCFIGHTHLPITYFEQKKNGKENLADSEEPRRIINIGSVGQPRDNNPRSSFAIFDTDTQTCEIERIDYDIRSAAEKIINAGLPAVLAERLFFGR